MFLTEFNSKPTRLKSVQIPVKLPTDEFGFPTGEYYPFMAYFVDKKEHDSEINRCALLFKILVTCNFLFCEQSYFSVSTPHLYLEINFIFL